MLMNASNLTVRFDGMTVVDGVSIELRAGEVVALIGPNGSGKSTLLRALLGLEKHDGMVKWEGRPAYLPQTPSMLAGVTVMETILSARPSQRGSFGLETAEDHRVLQRVSNELELNELLQRDLSQLSGGQRQRVFIARALAADPAALVLDEPATYLDLRHQVDLHRLLRQLAQSRQLGILLASHDLNLSAAHCDRMVLLSEGKVVREGAPEYVMDAQQLSEVYGVKLRRIDVAGAPMLVPEV
jgi:iron complex transport system ATP-binding protein